MTVEQIGVYPKALSCEFVTGTGGGKWLRATATAAVIALLAAAFAGCGGDDSTTTGARSGSTPADATAQGSPPNPDFARPGGDESVQRFGTEAPAAERAAASAVLADYLRAAAAERRVAQCRRLSAAALESLEQLGGGCASALEAVTPGQASSGAAMANPVGSLRVEGGRAYALYHGRDGVDYAVPMREEGGEWKVDALAPLELP